MQAHVKNYLEYYGYTSEDVILCERCKSKASDIHHIQYRSHFGTKKAVERDNVKNCIALCRECHTAAHEEKISKEELQNIHDQNL